MLLQSFNTFYVTVEGDMMIDVTEDGHLIKTIGELSEFFAKQT